MGAKKYTYVKTLIPTIDTYKSEGACIVEIGSERGEGSTSFLANFAKIHEIPFYTVDFDPAQYATADAICRKMDDPNIRAFCMKGEDFFTNVFPSLNNTIAFLYLDNFDFIYDHLVGHVDHQISAYQALGVTMNNRNSKRAHLKQTQLAEPFMHPLGFILCDDTFRRGPEWDGKCAYAIPYLLSREWQIVESDPGSSAPDNGYAVLQRVPE
jgi:hypothetical protein